MAQSYNRGYLGNLPSNTLSGIWKPQDVIFKQKQLAWGTITNIPFDPISYHDIFYYFGTLNYTEPWVNPVNTDFVVISSSSTYNSSFSQDQIIDRNNYVASKPISNTGGWLSDNFNNQWISVFFPLHKIKLTKAIFINRVTNYNRWATQTEFQASNDNINWVLLSVLPSIKSGESYFLDFSNIPYYQYFRHIRNTGNYNNIGELLLWGEIAKI